MIGRVINNYEIKSLIAEGGMGTVYLAEHPLIGRKVAVKVLRRMYLEDKQMSARFINEARAAHAIHHPNIVEVIDVGHLPDGPPYLMMEFLSGETLSMRLARLGRLPAVDAVRIIDQAASALEAAHAIGIIHRDLKPDNLFLVPEVGSATGAERVKVVDFGIAKLSGSMLAESIRTTGVVLGTPNYMSPEQCRGTGLDHRTDIYALGAILYELLCGKPPFVSQAQIDVMMMHVVKVPMSPREIVPDIPPHLEKVVLRALAKKASDRFASMAELRAALATSLPGSGPAIPIDEAGVESTALPEVRSASWARSRRRSPWVWAAVAVGVVGGWFGAARLYRPTPARPTGVVAGSSPAHPAGSPAAPAAVPEAAPAPAPGPAPAAPLPAPPTPTPAAPAAAAVTEPEGAGASTETPSRKKARRRTTAVVKERPTAGRRRDVEAARATDKKWMEKW